MELLRKFLGKNNFQLRSLDRTIWTWGRSVKKESKYVMANLPEIDLVVSTYGPSASVWLGKWFSKKYKSKWIVDYRDLAALRKDYRSNISFRLDCYIEKKMLRRCLGLISVSQYLSDLLHKRYGKKSEVIYNGFDEKKKLIKNKNKYKYIYYAGKFYNHRMDAVKIFMKSIEKNKAVKVKFRSLGPKYLEDEILSYARELNIKDRIVILPPVDPSVVSIESRNAFVNIVFEDLDNCNNWAAGTLTGKFLRLLAIDVPILSIARSDNEMGSILKITKKGQLCCTRMQIEQFLSDVEEDPKRFSGDSIQIDEFSKINQAKKMCNFFDKIMNSHSR
jgi:hypothetical protein